MTRNKLSVQKAAQLLGVSANMLYYTLLNERGLPESRRTYPFGQVKKARSGKSWRYDIYPLKLQKFLGLTDEEWERKVVNL